MADVSETLRRICLLYPWSRECAAVAPMTPSAAELPGMWHGEGGYTAAFGKTIPNGTRCESVQLIPIGAIGKSGGSVVEPITETQPVNSVYMQIRSFGGFGLGGLVLAQRQEALRQFF